MIAAIVTIVTPVALFTHSAAPAAPKSATAPATPEASAQDAGLEGDAITEASKRYQKGVELFEEGETEAALAEFHTAYSLKPHFAVLYNIAQCYYSLGKHDKALEYFTRYLDEGKGQIPKARVDEVNASVAHLLELMTGFAVSTIPEGAKVKVDDRNLGTTPFAEPVHVPAGPHLVEITLQGYLPVQEEVIFGGGQTLTKVWTLTQDKRDGTLIVTSPTPKAKIWIDGREMGSLPWQGKLPVGEHEVVVKAPGYYDVTRPVLVMPDEERELEVDLDVKGKPGKLNVETSVQGAQVFLDGIDVGTTPLRSLKLPAGVYHLRITLEGHASWEGDVTVQEASPTSVDAELARTTGKIGPAAFSISTSLAIAALGVAGAFGIMTLSKENEFESFLDAIPTGSEGANEVKLTQKYNRLRDEGRRYALIADVFWAVGGVAAACTVFLAFFTRFKAPVSKAKVSFGPLAGAGSFGLWTSWSF